MFLDYQYVPYARPFHGFAKVTIHIYHLCSTNSKSFYSRGSLHLFILKDISSPVSSIKTMSLTNKMHHETSLSLEFPLSSFIFNVKIEDLISMLKYNPMVIGNDFVPTPIVSNCSRPSYCSILRTFYHTNIHNTRYLYLL